MVTLRDASGAGVGVADGLGVTDGLGDGDGELVTATMSKVTSAVAVSGFEAESVAVTIRTAELTAVGFPLN